MCLDITVLQYTMCVYVYIYILLIKQLNRRKETMKRQLEQQSRDLNERRRQFEDDKRLFEKEYQEWVDSQSASQHDLKAGHGLV